MITIDTPAVTPSPLGGLMAVANVVPGEANNHAAYHGIQYEGIPCGHSRKVPTDGSDKEFEQREVVQGETFAIYRGIDSSLAFANQAEHEQLLTSLFNGSESFGVEEAVQELLLNPTAVDLTPTPGTPVTNPKLALGLLEQYAAEQSSGKPLIHTNLLGATLLEGELDNVPGTPQTNLGTAVAIGGGYGATGPGGVVAGPGQAWVYISGQVNIWPGTPHLQTGPALERNRNLTLAERTYVATVECFTAAILIGV